jgi:hypothetical protein
MFAASECTAVCFRNIAGPILSGQIFFGEIILQKIIFILQEYYEASGNLIFNRSNSGR